MVSLTHKLWTFATSLMIFSGVDSVDRNAFISRLKYYRRIGVVVGHGKPHAMRYTFEDLVTTAFIIEMGDLGVVTSDTLITIYNNVVPTVVKEVMEITEGPSIIIMDTKSAKRFAILRSRSVDLTTFSNGIFIDLRDMKSRLVSALEVACLSETDEIAA